MLVFGAGFGAGFLFGFVCFCKNEILDIVQSSLALSSQCQTTLNHTQLH